jgi:hypothetical protein
MKTRLLACVVLALAYGAYRLAPSLSIPLPLAAPAVAVPFEGVGKLAAGMSQGDRVAMREAYLILSRSVREDPAEDPVFIDTAAVRRAHRAALLTVWKGVLDNKTGEIPGLKEALEGAVNARIGSGDIPMNPSLKGETAKAFEDIAASVR